MNTQSRISFSLFMIMVVMFVIMIANLVYNFRDYSINTAINKAETIAQSVKHGLTAHMINGVMDHREVFLKEIENLEGLENLWLVRGQNVTEQYGIGFINEGARDDIDKEVLQSGQFKHELNESIFGSSSLRVTIPYIATTTGRIDCLSCHDAKVGDTLGVISMVVNIDDLKTYGVSSIAYAVLILFALMVVIMIFVNRLIGPYMTLFDSIKEVMSSAQNGDYSKRVIGSHRTESKEVANWVNGLLEKLQSTLNEIENKIHVFLTKQDFCEKKDPLVEVNNTVSRLSDIYNFRKTIEHDEDLETVYERIAEVLRNKVELEDFVIIEADNLLHTTTEVHIEKNSHCNANGNCRADRTNSLVDSCQFKKICSKFEFNDKQYMCVPYSISNDLDIVVSIVTHDEIESARVRKKLPMIQDYIDAAKPEIVGKKLMQQLEKSARTDPLTGLYNRKYLEESIDKMVKQANRSKINYGILMVDIDYFKMINDTYGHDVGDEAIRVIAQTLIENTRESDIVVRFGGEEFIVLLYNCDSTYIKDIAEKIRIAFAAKKIKAGNGYFNKTVSIGGAMYPEHGDTFWKSIKYADMALYEAKESGRDRVVIFDSSLLSDESPMDTNY
ncbi:GGDEF domain-containing protein [Arcobacter sp. FWKO B]|uniref:GGDEF domain-containing protein n=1 Tax=Arcobacter sp. FWKO B TaxID=2593672 RepID=UPI0018A45346|nr:GGDEF domain-containing protein [Arcobacter sp. FWKO B]QOG13183.1 GGDEF domain-containing protein [Arcobacter sp. FWKO B]